MKNLNNLLIAALTTLSFTISAQNSEEKIWVTIENNQDVPRMVNNKLVSSNETVQYLINTFEITNVEQAVPSSRVPKLQKVYEVTCNCDAIDLTIAIHEDAKELTNPQEAPKYELLESPNDYNTAFATDYALDLIGAKHAWDSSKGDSNTIIGISDGNYHYNHEELIGKVASADYTNASTYIAHGTAVAIAAAGNTNNGVGKSSIGYNCRLNLVGMNYNSVVEMSYAGARVINLSWTSGCSNNIYIQDIIDEVYNNGSIVVASAGNGSTCGGASNLVYPAACDHVIAVSSIGPLDNHERVIGDASTTHQHNSSVDICAPGYDVPLSGGPGWYLTANGTSFASPLVSGTIGLILSARPCLTFEEVQEILTLTAVNIDSLNPNYAGNLGAGRMDAGAACKLALTYGCEVADNGTDNTGVVIAPTAQTNLLKDVSEGKSIEKSELADLGTGDNNTNAVKMFPNPTTGTMTLSLDGINGAVVRIVDMNGKEISKEKLANSTKEYTIELNNQGMYVVEIQEEGSQTWSGKVSVI